MVSRVCRFLGMICTDNDVPYHFNPSLNTQFRILTFTLRDSYTVTDTAFYDNIVSFCTIWILVSTAFSPGHLVLALCRGSALISDFCLHCLR